MKTKIIKKQGKLTKAKARLIARLKGDGCIFVAAKTNYWIKLECRDEELKTQFASDIGYVYGLKTQRLMNTSGITGKPIEMVYVRSKAAYDDLMKYGPYYSKDWRVPKIIFESSRAIKKEFIRAFADDEGCVAPYRVSIFSINFEGLMQLKRLIEEFDIDCRIRGRFGCKKNVFAVIISRKENIVKFRDKIGFSLERKQVKLLKY
jgi:intein-encoded DNA endonuclease-like protein